MRQGYPPQASEQPPRRTEEKMTTQNAPFSTSQILMALKNTTYISQQQNIEVEAAEQRTIKASIKDKPVAGLTAGVLTASVVVPDVAQPADVRTRNNAHVELGSLKILLKLTKRNDHAITINFSTYNTRT
ncbi:hypothetical protein RND71_036450 [Anisodus tanguticus]|uniref:Uncharacterized protein n=1 Tax=Anisodus tanguticus TaxID=243964 RepID=A0AAE1R1P4_9SOLA|nr:hypothetical protein RND71_036450 [Anisodus tanguticus]